MTKDYLFYFKLIGAVLFTFILLSCCVLLIMPRPTHIDERIPTITRTVTNTVVATNTQSPTSTASVLPSITATITDIATSTNTSTSTNTPVDTATSVPTLTATQVNTFTPKPTVVVATVKPLIPRVVSTPKPSYTFKCNDGTVSYAKHRQGACSHHGGIAP